MRSWHSSVTRDEGGKEDAIACVNMAIAMQRRMRTPGRWRDPVENPFQLRIGTSTGYCTVRNFGSRTAWTTPSSAMSEFRVPAPMACRVRRHSHSHETLARQRYVSPRKEPIRPRDSPNRFATMESRPVRTEFAGAPKDHPRGRRRFLGPAEELNRARALRSSANILWRAGAERGSATTRCPSMAHGALPCRE